MLPDDSLDGVTFVHSSDLHIGAWRDATDLSELAALLDVASATRAQALLLAGDIFDHNRLPLEIVDRAARMLGDAPLQTVILPGNHDPATADSVYRRGGLGDPANVHVIGVTCDETLLLPELSLEVRGRAHDAYADMSPLIRSAPRKLAHQVAMAHGHWVKSAYDSHRSWLIYDDEIAASGVDYVALGHWDLAQPAGDGSVPAYYSGSPHHARTVNVVRLNGDRVDVQLVTVPREQP